MFEEIKSYSKNTLRRIFINLDSLFLIYFYFLSFYDSMYVILYNSPNRRISSIRFNFNFVNKTNILSVVLSEKAENTNRSICIIFFKIIKRKMSVFLTKWLKFLIWPSKGRARKISIIQLKSNKIIWMTCMWTENNFFSTLYMT